LLGTRGAHPASVALPRRRPHEARMAELLPNIKDLRTSLPHTNWRIGWRDATTSITWHYNGPPVDPTRQRGQGLMAQLRADAIYQMRPGWGATPKGADGLMYHFAIASDGTIYQTRDLDALLWHCAHADGNGHGLALHLPLGGDQAPTDPQLDSLYQLTDALRKRYTIPITRVFGHQEWKHATLCPGPALMAALRTYRAGVKAVVIPTPIDPALRRWRVRDGITANVRQGPDTRYPVAGRLKAGTLVYVDATKKGQAIEGRDTWVHMARVPNEQADLGFLWSGLGEWM